MILQAIALDDEQFALDIITHYCELYPTKIKLIKVFTKQSEAVIFLKKFPIDILFLDIQMPQKNGIDFYKDLLFQPKVIFTSAFSEYAIEGFNLSAVDYLLKPFSEERFLLAIEKVIAIASQNMFHIDDKNYLLIRSNFQLTKVLFEDIMYIEGLDDYLQIHLPNNKKLLTKMTMKKIITLLPANLFIRVQKSYIIAINQITKIETKKIWIANNAIPIGNSYRDFLKKI